MPLAIFDIDGTLTITSQDSRKNYWKAFMEVADIDLEKVDWKAISSSTDSGIIDQIFQQAVGQIPNRETVERIVDALQGYLGQSLAANPQFTRPVPGSVEAFHRLPELGWHTAIASGSWKATAIRKLGAVGIDLAAWPGAFGDDAKARADIIRLAWERARERYGRNFQKVVYVGDGAWDARAAARAGICFLGIGEGQAEEKLRSAGANQVIDCYRDFQGFLGCLANSACPAPAA